jgi:AraC-like DNA-binding protein
MILGLINYLCRHSQKIQAAYPLILPLKSKTLMKLYIKYMVSLRCKALVEEELKKLGVSSQHVIVDLGQVDILEDITEEQKEVLRINLLRSGMELLDERRSELIEKIKGVIIDMIYFSQEIPKVNYSDYISEQLGLDYKYLSGMFSEVKGITIQQFIITHKIERAKEMLLYGDHNLTEIAYRLDYSSVAHLSNGFFMRFLFV